MGGVCSAYGGVMKFIQVLVWKPEGKNLLEDPAIDGRIILRWISRKWDVGVCTGWSWLRIGAFGRHL